MYKNQYEVLTDEPEKSLSERTGLNCHFIFYYVLGKTRSHLLEEISGKMTAVPRPPRHSFRP